MINSGESLMGLLLRKSSHFLIRFFKIRKVIHRFMRLDEDTMSLKILE